MKKKLISLALALIMAISIFSVTASAVTASPSASTVYVNGAAKAFEAYNIGGANYFKLRDLAYVLNGTAKQFSVGYDNATKAITLRSGQPYVVSGGEMANGDGAAKTATPTPSRIYFDGKELNLTVYNIGGANFFKLRDLMEVVNVYVGYDKATKAITLDTSKGYASESTSNSTQMYSDWPTVPDYGALTGATLATRTVLDDGTTSYNYNVQSAPEGSIPKYIDKLKENGFSYVTSYEVDGKTRLMYNKDNVSVSIGVQSTFIIVLIRVKS